MEVFISNAKIPLDNSAILCHTVTYGIRKLLFCYEIGQKQAKNGLATL